MKHLTTLAAADDALVEIVKCARVVKLLKEGGSVVGVEYEAAGSGSVARGTVSLPLGAGASDWLRRPRGPHRGDEVPRGVGGLLLDACGQRFVDEVARRNAVTTVMHAAEAEGKGPCASS
ncbi:hypothetical protein C8R44DRAFT_742711 [Mycena epipterygia]|nr:hypothetical protein C8R44DRAFT_742711 [Mycena epipterygia]